jgi:uncharacterized membrane protein YhhN
VNGPAWTFAGIALVLGVADWWAVWTDRTRLRPFTKPASIASLIAAAVVLEPFDDTVRTWMVAGLVLSMAGDVFLLRSDREPWFVAGLGSFLLGHIAYVVAMASQFDSAAALAVGVAFVVASVALVGRRIVGSLGAAGAGDMVVPVVAYLVVISAMVVSAFGTAAPAAIVGALLFYGSDATLAWNRFIEQRRFGPVAVMVTYHLAQAALVAWLVTG